MHRWCLLTVTALCAAVTVAIPVAPVQASSALPVIADWQMNEAKGTPAGSQAMSDSSGNGFDGSVNVNVRNAQGQPDPSAPPRIAVGDTDASGVAGTAYRWPAVAKDPATGLTLRDDNRLALVPDDPMLDPLSRDYAVELKFLTGAPSPNLVQKGQSGPNAPLFKVEVHERKASCTLAGWYGGVFAKRAVGMPTDVVTITANQWHTIRCERTFNATKNTEDIAITVDGVFRRASFAAPAGSATVIGAIDSPYPVSIGGKSFCDPANGVGCDYFTGKMDYVRIEAGKPASANRPPTAAFVSACNLTACTFDGSGSSDPDGTVSSWAWSFGDSTTGAGTTTSHTFAAGGSYPVTLTVTDNSGTTSSTLQQVSVQAQPAAGIAFRGSSTLSSGSATLLQVPLPAGVQAGDALLLKVATAGTASNPTPPAGWTEVTRQVFASSTALTVTWQRVATSQDATAGKVPVTLASRVKSSSQILAYTGTATDSPVSAAVSVADTALTTSHATPSAQVSTDGSWVLSFWTDKSSTTTAWTPAAAVTTRVQSYGTGSGYLTTIMGDDGTTRSVGLAPTRTASTNATSRAAMTTIVLAPGGH